MSTAGSTRAILAALLANAGIAVAKFIGFLITGSSSMLAESVHSVADTSNQGLLLWGQRQARKEADALHQFGYGRSRYFYSFVVEKLSGMRLMKLSQLLDYIKDRAGFEEILRGLDVPAFAIKSPIAIDTVSVRAISVNVRIRSRNTVSEAVARPVNDPSPRPWTIRAQRELAERVGVSPALSNGRSRAEIAEIPSTASITPLPIPRAGTLITRRKLTSS